MPGLFDDLTLHLDQQDQSEKVTPFYERLSQELENQTIGVTAANLISLPAKQKKLMLLLIRDAAAVMKGISLKELGKKYPDLEDDLQTTLDELANDGWLIVLGEAKRISYRVNLGRKPGSKLGFGIWSMLSSRLQQGKS